MVSSKLLELEDSIQTLSLEEKLWLLDKIVQQMRATTEEVNLKQVRPDIKYDNALKPIWEIAVEIGSQIPESELEKVPRYLSKKIDLYQDSAAQKKTRFLGAGAIISMSKCVAPTPNPESKPQ